MGDVIIKCLEQFKYQTEDRTFNNIRRFIIDGKLWVSISDVCQVLGIKNVGNVIARLKKKNVRTTNVLLKKYNKRLNKEYLIKRKIKVCNRSGFFELVFRSRKPKALKFQDWVIDEVLPSIFDTGKYVLPNN